MTIDELKQSIYKIVSTYFKGAIVAWGTQKGKAVKPLLSFVQLTLGDVNYTQHASSVTDEDSGEIYKVIPSYCTLTVDLYTHGKKVNVGEDTFYENSALNDMLDFVGYMMSDYVLELCDEYNISVRTEGRAMDTSAVVDTSYEYRSRQVFIVMFTQESHGYAGISKENWSQTSSGGGSKDLAERQNYDVDADSINISNKF
jgi:hypothetical protein